MAKYRILCLTTRFLLENYNLIRAVRKYILGSYALPDYEEPKQVENWLKRSFDKLFMEQLNNWYLDESLWPQNRTLKMWNVSKNLDTQLKKLGCSIYFARPYRSCDRGLNEHTNGLIRRFFPKKTNFATVTDKQVQYVQDLLNDRPRKSLRFLTPNEIINKYLTKSYKKLSQLS